MVSRLVFSRPFPVRRWIFAVGVSIAFLACAKPQADREPSLEFIEVITGGADAEAALPLFIGIHGFGDSPENFSKFFADQAAFPARFAFARGPEIQGTGFSWFPLSWKTGAGEFADKFARSTQQVAELGHWLARNRPTIGEPVVFGFSQGGMLSYAIAGSQGHDFRAAVPIAGFLPRQFWPDEIESPIPVRAYHGAEDRRIFAEDARATVDHLRALGAPAQVVVYDDVGHTISQQMGEDLLGSLRMLAANPIGAGLPQSKSRQ